MFMAASTNEVIQGAAQYGYKIGQVPSFDWGMIKEKRDAYIKRLNGIYYNNMSKDNIQYIQVHDYTKQLYLICDKKLPTGFGKKNWTFEVDFTTL